MSQELKVSWMLKKTTGRNTIVVFFISQDIENVKKKRGGLGIWRKDIRTSGIISNKR